MRPAPFFSIESQSNKHFEYERRKKNIRKSATQRKRIIGKSTTYSGEENKKKRGMNKEMWTHDPGDGGARARRRERW